MIGYNGTQWDKKIIFYRKNGTNGKIYLLNFGKKTQIFSLRWRLFTSQTQRYFFHQNSLFMYVCTPPYKITCEYSKKLFCSCQKNIYCSSAWQILFIGAPSIGFCHHTHFPHVCIAKPIKLTLMQKKGETNIKLSMWGTLIQNTWNLSCT